MNLFSYSDRDKERCVPEAGKTSFRTDFERDRARILHSAALRRLGEKTQVLGPMSNDFIRTRLTHSLEVAQVGRELAKMLGADPDVVDAACLSHDLGHPPFGHNGEKILDELSQHVGGYEGNAQTLRILTRLEPKVRDRSGGVAGLNLTRSTLDAVCKYPWKRAQGPDRAYSMKKYSVYSDEQVVFDWLRQEAPVGRRCIEAQIMDLSDDIAYSVHDVEDGIATGKINLGLLADERHICDVLETTMKWYKPRCGENDLAQALERIISLRCWLTSFNGGWSDLAALKDLTSELIGRFCVATVKATRKRFGSGSFGRYSADLIVPEGTRAEILVLKGLAAHYVMEPRETEPVYYQQRTLLADLVDAVWQSGPEHLEPVFVDAWREAEDEDARFRVVIDQVASLTDVSAYAWHARLCGLLSSQL
ncbi:deoxyguanosinetriphosphate triphosphohydrolase [Schaalia sp. lx-100]|uniref:deoxyguanosinetriphosphate triphosphohydrolase n=1 Tax=Schaalia sp. lx-100 TaxID=2899081 RepID=UPI001E4F95CC|nr:deoxyguanosinetriphosphate triphosphohydrolase [Schaalia sp. lx-100]